ncbi:bestrophin family protein [Jatrophihabitans fulvus]
MIVSPVPRARSAWKRLVVPMAALLVWDVAITVAWYIDATHFDGISIQYSLFGTAIALFLGFMVNAAYARWWEARTLWGSVVNQSRTIAREATTLIERDEDGDDIGAEIVRTQIAYVHALRTFLRGQAAPDEVLTYLTPQVRNRVLGAANVPNALLAHISALLGEAVRIGRLSDISRMQMAATLRELSDAQGGLERIKRTPLPVQYRFLPSFFSRAFCVILPFAIVQDLGWLTPVGSGLIGLMFLLAVQIGHDLAEPFSDTVNDVPMTAICRTIEIDLLQALDLAESRHAPTRVPSPLQPVDDVLW